MSERDVVTAVVDHFVDRTVDGAARLVEALANRIGSGEIRKHLDAFDAARQEADAMEQQKFGGYFTRWFRK